MAGSVNQNHEYTRDQTPIFFLQDPILDLEISDQESEIIRDMVTTPIFFLQDPILDLEISDQESEIIRILAQNMAQNQPVPALQDVQEWPGMVILTNEVVSTRSSYLLIFLNVCFFYVVHL